MNRALGVGVVAGSAAALLVGAPEPASAHGFTINSSLGYMQVFQTAPPVAFHNGFLVWDNTGDNWYTRGEATLESGGKVNRTAGLPGFGPLAQYDASLGNPVTAVRKCHRLASASTWTCGDWVGA